MILSVKFIKKITSRLLVVIMIILGFFCVKGYNLYSDTIKQTPIEDIADNIQSQDNFTYYDELPQIYIDAVISAEDKRFEKHFGIDPICNKQSGMDRYKDIFLCRRRKYYYTANC